jgi:aminopeptidase N
VTRRVAEFYAFRVGPYAYEKLAHVQSRTRFGGMENAGNIFYTEKLAVERGAEGIAAHEIAHQWFGDSVTEADWHHVWLSEGFATYFTHLFNEFTYGRERLVSGLRGDRLGVIEYARKNPDLRIVDPRVPENRVLSTYTYQKGGWVLHMLRRTIGDERFWEGVREYYGKYRDATVLSEDFRDVMERVSGVDLHPFFQQWLYEPGHPRLRLTWGYDAPAKVLSVTVDQRQPGQPFRFDLDVGLTFADGTRRIETIALTDASRTVTIPLDTPPVALAMDPDTWLLAEFERQRE